MNTQHIETTTETRNPVQLSVQPVGASARAAYERRLAEIQAVPDSELPRVALDVHAAVATVLGALPAILALRESMARLPSLKAALVDGLADYAWAASEANARYEHAAAPSEDLGPLLEEATKARETFRLDAVSLAHRGFIEQERLTAFKGLTGYKNVAFDLMDWAFVLRECWSRIEGKSGLSAEEVDAAAKLGEHLLTQASLREQQPERIAEAAHVRQQAILLLAQAYDEVRRAITYLRWQEDDVESIAPSLFLKNGRRPKGDAAPAATDGASPAAEPVAPAAPTAAAAPGPAVHVTAAPTPPPGMPGARLFVDG
jgi:hypothetical protein